MHLTEVKDLTFTVVLRILGEFIYLFLASALLGLAFGLFTAFCLRRMHIEHTTQVSGTAARWGPTPCYKVEGHVKTLVTGCALGCLDG